MIFFSTRFRKGISLVDITSPHSGKFSLFIKFSLLAVLAIFNLENSTAQCQLSPSVGTTVPITISVNNSCQATLNTASLNPFVSTTPPPAGCALYIDADAGPGVTLVTSLVLTLGGSPGSGVYGVYSDNDGVVDLNTTGPVFVNVTLLDNTFPTLGALASPVTANTNADGAGNCSVAINMPTPSWTENCVNSTTWMITYTAGSPAPTNLPSNESYTIGTLPGGWPMAGGSLNRTFFSSSTGTPGRTIVTFKVTDGAGQSAVRTITVAITDNENPVATCPGSLNVFTNNDASPQNCTFTVGNNSLNATATDNCTVASLTHNLAGAPSNTTLNGASFPIGLTNVIWTATDAAGNINNCNFNVTVIDNTLPVISCPANLTVNTDLNVCTATNVPGIAMIQAGSNNPGLLPLSAGQSYDNCDNSLTTQYSYNGPTSSGGLVGGSNAGNNVFSLGTYTINYRVTDDALNTRQCNFSLTIQDVQTPAPLTCPGTINTTTLIGQCNNTVTWTPPVVPIDNCPGTVILDVVALDQAGNPVTVLTANTPGCVGSTQFAGTFAPGAWTTDLNGGNGSVDVSGAPAQIRFFEAVNPSAANTEFEIVVPYSGILTFSFIYNPGVGNGDPFQYTINGAATTVVTGNAIGIEFGAISVPVLAGQVFGFRQNSNGNASQADTRVNGLVFTCSQGSFATFPGGANTVTYTATDDNGNSTTCSFDVNVVDNEAPVALCQNISVNANGTVQAVNINSGSTDNCGIVTYGISTNALGPFTPSVSVACVNTTLHLQVTDAEGNTGTCASTITVIDATPPVITCPVNVNANTAASLCTATLNLAPASVSDNCTTMGSIVVTHNTTGVSSLSGPGNITGGVFNKGITNVTFTATDGAGLNSSCAFSVNVIDNQSPTQTGGQANGTTITQNAGAGLCSALVNWTAPSFNDNCGTVNTVSTHTSPTTFPVGPTVVTYTAQDLAGNSTVVSFTVNIVDNSGPLAQCKDITVNLNSVGTVSVNGSQLDAGSQDDCGIASRKISKDGINFFDPITFNCIELGVNSVILQVADANNNTANCNSNVTVLDITDPTPVCHNISVNLSATNPGLVTIYANSGNPSESINFGSTDNCTIVNYEISVDGGAWASDHEFDCSDDGVHTAVLRVTDQSANDATCLATVTVNDITFPSITCPAPASIGTSQGGTGDCNGTLTWTNPIPSDNCNIVSYTVTANGSTVTVVGNTLISRTFTEVGSPHTVVYSVTDENNNVTTCAFTVSVTDDENPTMTCAASATRGISDDGNSGDCIYEIQGAEFDLTAYNDNCGVLLITNDFNGLSTLDGELLNIGTYNVVWTVTDFNSLTNTCSVTIEVEDDEVPVFNYCPSNIVLPSINNNCSNLASWSRPQFLFSDIFDCDLVDVDEIISDNGIQSSVNLINPYNYFVFGPDPLVQAPVGITTVTYVATDNNSNTSSCSFTITILDAVAPLIACPGSQTLGTICASGTVPTYQPISVTDNCNDYTVTQSPAGGVLLGSLPGITPAAGQSFLVTLTATDDNPNSLSSSCSFTVTLTDSQNPIPSISGAILPPIDTTCGSFVVTAPKATDCGQVIYGLPSPSGSPLGGTPPQYIYTTGVYNVIWTYIDNQSNTSSQSQLITITNDTRPPVALCKNHTLNLNGNSSATINSSNINNGSYDNCGPVTLALNNSLFTCSNVGANTVVLTVTDGSSLQTTCSATVTVVDNVSPVLNNVPNDITLDCSVAIPTAAVVTASDACGATVSFVETTTQTATGCAHYTYTIVRNWTATDGSNTVSDSQIITVIDNTAPVFTGLPANLTVNTSLSAITCSAAVSLTVSANDCVPTNQLTFTNNAPFGNGTTSINGTYNVGIYNITFTVTDFCNNTRTQVLVLEVKDVTPPTPLCVNSITVPLNGAGTLNLISTAVNNGSYDNCPGTLTYDLTPSMFGCSDVGGTIPVTLTVTDANGNSAFCTTNLQIQENTLPIITSCPASITVQCGVSLNPAVNSSLGVPTSTDNCGILSTTFIDQFLDGPGTYCGDYRRTWTVTDSAGNIRLCTQTITVEDLAAPSLPNAPANLTLECGATIPAAAVMTATDNCDGNVPVNYSQIETNVACGGYNKTLVRTWSATDDCGNAVTRIQSITIQDTQAPNLTFIPATVNVNTSSAGGNTCLAVVSLNTASLILDCVPVSSLIVTNNAPFGNGGTNASGNYPPGTYVITFTATDLCGNSSTRSVTLTVTDNNIPVAECLPVQAVTLGSNGQAVVLPASINNGSYDNCTTLSNITLSPNTFDCGDLGQNVVTLTVTDGSGNTNTCTSVVTVSSNNPALNLNLNMSSIPTSFFGANNGTASVSVTGGGGSYTYDWSNDGPESPDNDGSSIGGLAGGTYSVTVTDVLSGCQAIGMVTVAEGNVVAFNVGTASGTPGAIVNVPVTVQYFNNIGAFQFTLHLANPAVGTILGASGFNLPGLSNLNFNVINASTLGVAWITASATGNTVGQNVVIFNIQVQLAGTPGISSPVTLDNNPVDFEVNQVISGNLTLVPANSSNGSVSITSFNSVQVEGDIFDHNGNGVAKVGVAMTGSSTGNMTTTSTGDYAFSAAVPGNIKVKPSKNTKPTNGVTVADLFFMQQVILTNDNFDFPWQFIAADVNKSGMLTTVDIVECQYLILNLATNFSNNTSWRFVDADFVLPANPLGIYLPDSIVYNPLTLPQVDGDFLGIKIGDPTGNANPDSLLVAGDERNEDQPLVFEVDNRQITAGETFDVIFKAKGFTDIIGYQTTLNFEVSALELLGAKGADLNGLDGEKFALNNKEQGKMTTLWFGHEPTSMPDGTALFTMTFKAISSGRKLSEILSFGSDITYAEAIDANGNVADMQIEFIEPINNNGFELFQNQPNPFKTATTIGFNMPESGNAVLTIFDISGKVIKLIDADYSKGYQTVSIGMDELNGSGAYYYQLETAENVASKKMILVR